MRTGPAPAAAKGTTRPSRKKSKRRTANNPQRGSSLPYNLPPIGLSREQAAELIGVSPTTFDRLVAEGLMPQPIRIYGRVTWDREAVITAYRALDTSELADNDWLGATQ